MPGEPTPGSGLPRDARPAAGELPSLACEDEEVRVVEPERPVFSIVVPTYRRPKQLAACLQALAKLDYARERFEVIVVDDGSTTPPEAVVTSFQDRLQVTLVLQPHAGSAAARNTGAERARGEYLA